MSVDQFVNLSSTDETGSIAMTVSETITSALPSTHSERTTGHRLPDLELPIETVERIQRHDLNYRSDCAWCVQLRNDGRSLPILAVPLHVTYHLPIESLAGLNIQYVGTPRDPAGVLVTLHHHDIAQVVGIASALGVVCTSAQRLDPETVSVRFGEWNYLRDGLSVVWFAGESDVKDLLTLFPDLHIKDMP